MLPARGGSKRIPRKNIRPLLGVPMITRTISMLLATDRFDEVVVSTDDDEVAAVAVAAGATVPFRRPAALADDHTPTAPVVAHALDRLAGRHAGKAVCVAYPAAVFVTPDDVAAMLERLRASGAEYCFTATTFAAPVQRALRRRPDGRVEMLHPEHRDTRSQDLEETLHDAGQLYVGRWEAWSTQRPVLGADSVVHVLPRWRVQDVDTPEDWERAELLLEVLERRG